MHSRRLFFRKLVIIPFAFFPVSHGGFNSNLAFSISIPVRNKTSRLIRRKFMLKMIVFSIKGIRLPKAVATNKIGVFFRYHFEHLINLFPGKTAALHGAENLCQGAAGIEGDFQLGLNEVGDSLSIGNDPFCRRLKGVFFAPSRRRRPQSTRMSTTCLSPPMKTIFAFMDRTMKSAIPPPFFKLILPAQ